METSNCKDVRKTKKDGFARGRAVFLYLGIGAGERRPEIRSGG